jgi:hypothetical protein
VCSKAALRQLAAADLWNKSGCLLIEVSKPSARTFVFVVSGPENIAAIPLMLRGDRIWASYFAVQFGKLYSDARKTTPRGLPPIYGRFNGCMMVFTV